MRKLASIQKIWDITPIEGADRIELAHVEGWQSVVNKGTFKPMDNCVYFEIDSFLPIRPEFEFLRHSSYKKNDFMGEGFKLRTIKIRGEISQGLCLPISAFAELKDKNLEVGTDVTELLGVKKWEIEERATKNGTIIGDLPSFVPHSDETRIQTVDTEEFLKEFHGKEYYISTKMDGSSHAIAIDDENVHHLTTHNTELKIDGKSSFNQYVAKNKLFERLQEYKDNNNIKTIAVVGEFCGAGIQKNRLKLVQPQWYIFTIEINGKRIGLAEMKKIADAIGNPTVPIEEVGYNFDEKYPTEEAIFDRAYGNYPNGGLKEGIVVRPTTPVYSQTLHNYLSFKAVNNAYLLKHED